MRRLLRYLKPTLVLLFTVTTLQAVAAHAQTVETFRLVTLGGTVTEIVYALDAQYAHDSLVGTDQSSLYPPHAQTLPSVGYYRRLPAEGVASLNPSLIIASENTGPPQVLQQLQSLGIEVVQVSDQPTEASLRQRIAQIAESLGKVEQGQALVTEFEHAMGQAKPTLAQQAPTGSAPATAAPSAMMIVMRGGKLLAAGGDTTAHVVMSQAGLHNSLSRQKSYQPISAEAVSALAPEVLIVTSSTVESLGGIDQVKAQPAIALTPAVRNGRVVVLDDLLIMGFGLRLPQAIVQIRQQVDSELKH